MSDVSKIHYAHITEPLCPSPYFSAQQQATSRALKDYGFVLKTDKIQIQKLVYESDYFQDEYTLIEELYGPQQLENFKGGIMRGITCGIAQSSLNTPIHGVRTCFMCRSRGCFNCARYQAKEKLYYVDSIIRYTVYNSVRHGDIALKQMMAFVSEQGWDWLAIVLTPLHDGRAILRVSNLRPDMLNPLIDDNEVKESIALFDIAYPHLDTMKEISAENTSEKSYQTGSGFIVTSTEIYMARPHGKATKERGTRKGWEFNHELGEMVKITAKELKKKKEEQDDKDGVVVRENVPGIALTSDMTKESLMPIVVAALKENSYAKDKPLFGWNNVSDIPHTNVNIMNSIRNKLALAGNVQPDIFHLAKTTQKQIDEFDALVGIPAILVPDNILSIKFTDEMLGQDGPIKGMRARVDARNNRLLYQAQQKFITAPTYEELAARIIDGFLKLE